MNLAHALFPRGVAAVLALALALAACAGERQPAGEAEEAGEAPAPGEAPAGQPAPAANPLLDPTSQAMNATAPDLFRAKFETSKGDFVIEVHRDWAPHGADHFYNLVGNGYYDGVRFFRVIDGFMAQFGIHGDPKAAAAWRGAQIPDDPVVQSNRRGYVSYAMAGPNTRTTQVFINFVDNSRLDDMGFSPFGAVVEGMEVVDQLYSGYGEGAPRGTGPAQARIQAEGNQYLEREFPELDSVERATIVQP